MLYIEATIKDEGIIIPKNFKTCQAIFRAKGLIDTPVILGIEKHRKQRSKRQNRYIWGVVVPIIRRWIKETQGETISKDQAYAYIRMGILGDEPIIKTVAGVETITMENKRLSQRTTKEFAENVEEIVQIMAERGCHIPLPNEENLLTDIL